MKVRPSSILQDKEYHHDTILSAYQRREQAFTDARVCDQEFVRLMCEARADGVQMNELAAWTGLSRQWLRQVMSKNTT